MIAWVCVTFVMFVLVCVVAVCVEFAKDGVEDADGFHFTESSRFDGSGAVVVNREMKIGASPAQPVATSLELAAGTE